jgi:hypothetical protein
VANRLRPGSTGIFLLSADYDGLVKEASVSDDTDKPLALQDLPELRRKTESVSRFLQAQIAAHLETLRPLFAPERIFGKLASGKVEVSGAERALAELQQSYKAFMRKPYDLPEILETYDRQIGSLYAASCINFEDW